MGICLVLTTVSRANAERIRSDPPAVWLALGDEQQYLAATQRSRGGWLGKLFGRSTDRGTAPANLERAAGEGESCDIDKSWHALHFLLARRAEHVETPVSFLAERGRGAWLCDLEIGYGPPEYREPEEVRAFAGRLSQISAAEVEARFDASELDANGIYPEHWN